MKSRHFSTLLAVFALTIALAGRAEASCIGFVMEPPCQAYWSAHAVFVGTVKKVSYSATYQRGEGDSRRNYRRRITRFSVETAYKGVEGKVAEVVTEEQMWVPDAPADGEERTPLLLHPPPTDCDYRFDEGETYFVYANSVSERNGTLNVPQNRTRKLEEAAADLKFVNGLPRAAPTARIFGRIVRADLSVNLGDQKRLPLAGIKVTARSGKRTFEALTDAEGKYELKDLPPGSYQVTPTYPAHLSADRAARAQVVARGCAQLDFDTHSSVRLKGRVIDAEGRPLLGVEVGLIHAEATEVAREGLYTWTGGGGDYVLTGIPAGRFLLFFDLPSAPAARVPHPPRAYYPGVWSAAQGTVITVADGQNLPAFDLQLLPPPADRAVEIVLRWPDGRPVGGAWVTLEDPDYDWEGSIIGAKKVDGQEGHYQATGFDGITYWARAHVNVEGGGVQMHAEPVKFTLTEGAGPIKLVITEPGGHCPHYRRK
ncbi:MAG TPA: carboxypeptidase-like regulatory domain-containing protein [Pyrinomonadaceae bacterium]|nr:carboxypeptidase-like regulatory domain-containing protein [Pyrinomonadaceae bacterium]